MPIKEKNDFEDLKEKGSTLSVHTGAPWAIKGMQKELNNWGYTDQFGERLAEDGVFGKKTFNSVIKYQLDNNLVPDGIVGDKTWKSMSDRKKDEAFYKEAIKNNRQTESYDGANAEISDVFSTSKGRGINSEAGYHEIKKEPDTYQAVFREGYNQPDMLTLSRDNSPSYYPKANPRSVAYPGGIAMAEKYDYVIENPDNAEYYFGEAANKNTAFVSRKNDTEITYPAGDGGENKYWSNSGSGEKTKSKDTVTENEPKTEKSGIMKPGYNKKGEWSNDPDADDFGKDSAKYKLLHVLDKAWDTVPI